MSKPIDNQSARDAARAQQVVKAQQTGTGKNTMGLGVPQSPSAFGQILQEQMGETVQRQSANQGDVNDEGSDEPTQEPRESGRQKEGVRHGSEQHRRVHEKSAREESRDSEQRRDDSSGSEKKDSTQHAKQAEQKVVSKQGRGDTSGGQQQPKQDGRQGAGQQSKGQGDSGAGKGQQAPTKQAMPKPMWGQGATSGAQKAESTAQAGKAAPPKGIPQRVIDQIVSYARLVVRKGGETEIELALKDEVFKGLRMRIRTKNGKIKATFITSSREVKELFLAEKQSLQHELSENGLAVEGIDVIMT